MSGTTSMIDAVNAYKHRTSYAQRDLDRLMRFMDLGWVRHLPPAVALVLEGIDDMPRAVIDELVEHERGAPVWEQDPYDDEVRDAEFDLKVAATLHPEVTDRTELQRLSLQDRAEASAHQRACQDRFSRVCSALSIAEPKRIEEIYPFLLDLGVIEEYLRGANAWVRSLETEVDPIDVLRLDEQTAAKERACRGEMRFLAIEAKIAEQFRAAGGRDGRLTTSLLRLVRLARQPIEELRLRLAGGVDAGILTCNQDLGTLQEHRIFELRIASGTSDAAQHFIAQYHLAG
jgi:hypothetical protein